MQQDRTSASRQRDSLSVFQVMPREMYFGELRATSIDLCVRDLVSFSRFRATTRIFAEATEDGFPGFMVDRLPAAGSMATFRRANHVARAARQARPDIIVVQQHLPTAAAIALRLPWAKIVLHTHNFQKSYADAPAFGTMFRQAARSRRYRQLAGIIHVSEACRNLFERAWPVGLPGCVVNNGLDFDVWHPATKRDQQILYIGRCAPEKGTLETAIALRKILPGFPDWRTRFILSAVGTHARYFEQTRDVLAELGPQAEISVQRPYGEIRQACEHAAIAIVPSICREAFGRTALEAHAGGAALISSGSGGLSEISGQAALFTPDVTARTIEDAVKTLLTDPALRKRLAHEGAGRVRERFDIRSQAARLDGFLLDVAGRCNQAASGGTKADKEIRKAAA
ncbi:MAG: glycosyltransferase family 4 protein [Rhodomicrobiaceae bacterium]